MFVFEKISREYTAPNTVARVIIGVDRFFQSIMVEIIRSSPMRLGVGGMPRFDMQVIIHQRVRSGVTSLNPRVTDKVRVFFRSYRRLAKQNSAEEIRPCATIRVNAPFTPHRDMENIPEATILICPTDE